MTAGRTNIAGEREVEGTGLDSRFELDFLEGDELSGELVPGLVDDAVGALADLLDLDEVVEADRVLAVHVGAKEGTEDDATTKFLLASLLLSNGIASPIEALIFCLE